jgi:hypothetical protein
LSGGFVIEWLFKTCFPELKIGISAAIQRVSAALILFILALGLSRIEVGSAFAEFVMAIVLSTGFVLIIGHFLVIDYRELLAYTRQWFSKLKAKV